MTLKAVYSTISAASIAEVVVRNFKIGPTARCRLFARGVNDIYELGERLGARLAERAASLSVGQCHGDNHGGNTLIADGAGGEPIPGWFDFDDAGPGFLAHDLATFPGPS